MKVIGAIVVAAATTVLAQRDAVLVYDRALTDAYHLRVTTAGNGRDPADGGTLRVVLQSRGTAPQTWELLSARIRDDQVFAVERATARAVVLSWTSDPYGSEHGYTKLFLDLPNKRIEKRVDYPDRLDVEFASDRDAAAALGVTRAQVEELRGRGVFATAHPQPSLPQPFVDHSLPQSTTAEAFAMRPQFKANGWTAGDIGVEETIESFQQVGDRIWFGKSFYDAEGQTGVGAIGWLDRAGAYTFLKIPALVPWSVAALLVEPPNIWAGLVHHGEGATVSGGLMHHDLRSGHTAIQRLPDVIHSIVSIAGALFIGTERGLYVVRGGVMTRYRMEPAIDGRFVVISQRL
jgi:hypothetical protein